MNKIFGIVLICLGVFGLAWGRFTYTTTERIVDTDTIHATRERTHDVALPPILGGVAIVGGIALVAPGKKQ